jgi:hypothetical protein
VRYARECRGQPHQADGPTFVELDEAAVYRKVVAHLDHHAHLLHEADHELIDDYVMEMSDGDAGGLSLWGDQLIAEDEVDPGADSCDVAPAQPAHVHVIGHTRVVVGAVQAAKGLDRRPHQPLHVTWARDIRLYVDRLAPRSLDAADRLAALLLVNVGHDHLDTIAGKGECATPTNSRSGARHESHPSTELPDHSTSSAHRGPAYVDRPEILEVITR